MDMAFRILHPPLSFAQQRFHEVEPTESKDPESKDPYRWAEIGSVRQ
jgi:hypothetical protein